jgi:hypothetical protein
MIPIQRMGVHNKRLTIAVTVSILFSLRLSFVAGSRSDPRTPPRPVNYCGASPLGYFSASIEEPDYSHCISTL